MGGNGEREAKAGEGGFIASPHGQGDAHDASLVTGARGMRRPGGAISGGRPCAANSRPTPGRSRWRRSGRACDRAWRASESSCWRCRARCRTVTASVLARDVRSKRLPQVAGDTGVAAAERDRHAQQRDHHENHGHGGEEHARRAVPRRSARHHRADRQRQAGHQQQRPLPAFDGGGSPRLTY